MRPSQLKFVKEASARYGVGAVMSRGMIDTLADEIGMQKPNWLKQKEYRVGHGMFKLPEVLGLEPQPQPSATVAMAQTCLLYTSPSPRDGLLSRMPSSA